MPDDIQLSGLSRALGFAVAKIEMARQLAEVYGNISEPYESKNDGYDDLTDIAKSLLQTKVEIDLFMDTLPRKQQEIYAQTIEECRKD